MPARVVIYGSAQIDAECPDPAEIARNIAQGQAAFSRLKDRLLTPGVHLPRKKGVPLYYCDGRQLIQELDGKLTRGTICDGKFVPVTSTSA